MNISLNSLKSLNACESGYDNFKLHHPNFDGPLKDAIALPNIPYGDKLWSIKTLVPKNIYDQWLKDCINNIIVSYDSTYLDGPLLRGQLNIIQNNIDSSDELKRNSALQAADALKDIVCKDYPAQEDVNIQLMINLL